MLEIDIRSHRTTVGCIADFTRVKIDDKISILTGHICEQHQSEIKTYYGIRYLDEILVILSRKWIGKIEEKDSVAYNLKHAYKFDIYRDSGFKKSFWEKCQDKFYEIPGSITGEIIKVILTVLVTYFLIKYGLVEKNKS